MHGELLVIEDWLGHDAPFEYEYRLAPEYEYEEFKARACD